MKFRRKKKMAWASITRKKLNKISKSEKVVEEMLKSIGVFAHRNWGFQTKGGKYRFVDFFLRKKKLIIEIDGMEHNLGKDMKREIEILEVFKKYKFIRFTNNEVINNPEDVKNKIIEAVSVKVARSPAYVNTM